MDSSQFEDSEQFFQYLIDNGIMNLYGMTDDNQVSYSVNFPKLKELLPDFYKILREDVDALLVELYKKDLVTVEYDEDLNAKYGISEEAYEILRQNGYDMFFEGED